MRKGRKSMKCPLCKHQCIRLYQRTWKDETTGWKSVGWKCPYCGHYFEELAYEYPPSLDESLEPLASVKERK